MERRRRSLYKILIVAVLFMGFLLAILIFFSHRARIQARFLARRAQHS